MKRTPGGVTGFVILMILGVVDVFSVGGLRSSDGPPAAVLDLGAALGLATLVAGVPMWRGGTGARLVVVATRIISALTSIPAFFADGVPVGLRLLAAVTIVLTAVGIWLVAARSALGRESHA